MGNLPACAFRQERKNEQTIPNMATKKEPTTGLRKLMEDQLADIYFAEKQLVKALPKMAKNAGNADLRAAFEGHLQETHGQIERLEQVFGSMGLPAKGKTCPAILGLLQECTELMDEFGDDEALDAALVAGARKVEHYEIATYGSLSAWAEQLGLDDAAGLLQETLEEEQGADEKLTGIGEEVMGAAVVTDDEEEEELAEVEEDSLAVGKSKPPSNGSRIGAKSTANGNAKKKAVGKR